MKRLLMLALLLAPVAAELPPLPQEARQNQSARIVVAQILTVKQLRIDSPKDFPKVVYEASAEVESVAKGEGLKAGDVLRCTYWKAGQRPQGWAGPGGQYNALTPGSKVRLYLTADNQILNPNGWEKP